MKSEYFVEFRPDNNMGALPRDIGPFPYESWALGWAFIEMKGVSLGWWTVKKRTEFKNYSGRKRIKARNT